MSMNKLLALCALLLAACSGTYEATLSGPHVFRTDMTLWLQEGDQGYEEQLAWGLPLPYDFGVANISDPDEFLAACLKVTSKCSETTIGVADIAHSTVILLKPHALLHEMGHILRGRGGHLDCSDGSAHVMCAYDTGATEPTSADLAFVLGEK